MTTIRFGGTADGAARSVADSAAKGLEDGARAAASKIFPEARPGEKITFTEGVTYAAAALVVAEVISWVGKKVASKVTPQLEKATSNKFTKSAKEGAYTVFEKAEDGWYYTKGKLKKFLGFKTPEESAAAQAAYDAKQAAKKAQKEAKKALPVTA